MLLLQEITEQNWDIFSQKQLYNQIIIFQFARKLKSYKL